MKGLKETGDRGMERRRKNRKWKKRQRKKRKCKRGNLIKVFE